MNDEQIEQAVQAKGLTAPRVTAADVEAEIHGIYFFTAEQGARLAIAEEGAAGAGPLADALPLRQVTVCVLVTRNGHRLVGVNTGPVSPENFDAELGRKLARANAVDQLWPLLGYQLRCQLAEEAHNARVLAVALATEG